MGDKIKSKSFTFDCGDKVERYNHPYLEFCDGSTVPYGYFCDDNIYRICYSTTSRYGYNVKPIYGVRHDFNDDKGYPDHMYHIFIGECPHKDENGNWVTYNEVPNFMIDAFAGAHFIDAESDIPHIIRIETDEFEHQNRERQEESYNKVYKDARIYEYEINHCTFRMYLHGLYNRMKQIFGEFTKYTGEQYKYIRYYNTKNDDYCCISLMQKLDGTEKYFIHENDDFLRFLYFKKDGKWCLKYEKDVNYHVNCSC